MSGWDRGAYSLLMAAAVIGANAINEGVREGNIATGLVLVAVAVALVGGWWLVRWLETRHG